MAAISPWYVHQIELCLAAKDNRSVISSEQDFVNCARKKEVQSRAAMRAFTGNVNCVDGKGYTALVAAIMAGNSDVVSMLAQRSDVNVKDRVRGHEPIIWAVRHCPVAPSGVNSALHDQDDMVRMLVQLRSVDVNVGAPKYVYALHIFLCPFCCVLSLVSFSCTCRHVRIGCCALTCSTPLILSIKYGMAAKAR